jgi:hypothetical protein
MVVDAHRAEGGRSASFIFPDQVGDQASAINEYHHAA